MDRTSRSAGLKRELLIGQFASAAAMGWFYFRFALPDPTDRIAVWSVLTELEMRVGSVRRKAHLNAARAARTTATRLRGGPLRAAHMLDQHRPLTVPSTAISQL